MVKAEITKVQDNYRREVLRDQNQKTRRLGKFMAGLALAVVGVGAAFAASELLEDDSGAVMSPAAIEAARAQGMVEHYRNLWAARNWTLEDEIAAIRGNSGVSQVGPKTNDWTLEDEIAAIRGNSGVSQPVTDQANTQRSGPR